MNRRWLLRSRLFLLLMVMALVSTPVWGKTQLTLSMWGSSEYWNPLFEKFQEEHPDIEIRLYERAQGQYFDAILTMFAGGAAPDLVVLNPQNVSRFIESGLLLNLDRLIARDNFTFEEYLEPGWAYGLHHGSYYAWPAGIDPAFPSHLFAYNRDLFSEGGLPDLTPEWTNDDLLEIGKRLTLDRNADGVPEVYGLGRPTLNWYSNWVWSNGGQILSEDRKRFLLLEPESLEALELLVDLMANRHGITATRGGAPPFASGEVAIGNFSLSAANNLAREGNISFDWSVMSYPRGRAGSIARAGDLPLGINSASPHVEQAWTFLKWMVREDVQEWAALDARILAAPVHKSVILSDRFVRPSGPPHDLMPLIMQEYRFLPVFSRWIEFDRLVQGALNKAINERVDVRVALEEVKGLVEQILEEE